MNYETVKAKAYEAFSEVELDIGMNEVKTFAIMLALFYAWNMVVVRVFDALKEFFVFAVSHPWLGALIATIAQVALRKKQTQ